MLHTGYILDRFQAACRTEAVPLLSATATFYCKHNSDILPIVELDGRSLCPQQRWQERYWKISKLTNTKIHRHGIAWRIHAISSIWNRPQTRTCPSCGLCVYYILCTRLQEYYAVIVWVPSRKAPFIRRLYIQCRSTKKLQGQLISALVNICSLWYLHNLFHTALRGTLLAESGVHLNNLCSDAHI